MRPNSRKRPWLKGVPTSGLQTSICAFEGTSLDVEILVEIE
jgi:hypothetical protein